jgi:hypothetical protein
MKKLSLVTVIFVSLLFVSNLIQAQTTLKQLDQLKLMEQFLGTWQQDVGKDTVFMWEFQKYGKAIFANTYNIIKSQKIPFSILCYGFDKELNKFKGYSLSSDGSYGTWIASFTSQSVYHVEAVQNLNPDIIYQKFDCVFENPNQWSMTTFNQNGVKVAEVKNIKVK